jgi:hypothetical protein
MVLGSDPFSRLLLSSTADVITSILDTCSIAGDWLQSLAALVELLVVISFRNLMG